MRNEPIKTDVGEFLNSAVIWLVLGFFVIPAVVMGIIQWDLENTGKIAQPLKPGQNAGNVKTPADH
jgi:hypothetical protein